MLKSAIEKTQDVCIRAYDEPITGHRSHVNSYESPYSDNHEVILATLVAMQLFVYIKGLVLYIISESQCVMVGTVYKKYWYFYHDSLSLVTATEKNAVDGRNND